MRKSIDGLMEIVRDTYELDPYSNSLFLFCGRRCDRIKALHFEKDGFCLYYKRLDNGRFQWPRDSSEVRNLSRQDTAGSWKGCRLTSQKRSAPPERKSSDLCAKRRKFFSLAQDWKARQITYPQNQGTAWEIEGITPPLSLSENLIFRHKLALSFICNIEN